MNNKHQGFTLIELMIVVAIIAIIASIAIPNLISARLTANESAAIATLKNVSAAQSQCQCSSTIDANNDGAGEFAYFAELAGRVDLRGSTIKLAPPMMSTAFGNVQAGGSASGGVVIRSGYHFQMWLPDAAGGGTPEATTGGVSGTAPDAVLSEKLWACYAWPSTRETTGKRVFFVNQACDVMSSLNTALTQLYSGNTAPPSASAAFLAGTSGVLSATTAANTLGTDGGFWTVVN